VALAQLINGPPPLRREPAGSTTVAHGRPGPGPIQTEPLFGSSDQGDPAGLSGMSAVVQGIACGALTGQGLMRVA